MTIYTPDSLVTRDELTTESALHQILVVLVAEITYSARINASDYGLGLIPEDALKDLTAGIRVVDDEEYINTFLSEAVINTFDDFWDDPDVESPDFVVLMDIIEMVELNLLFHASETRDLMNSAIADINAVSLPLWYKQVADTHPHMEAFRDIIKDAYGVFKRVDKRDVSSLMSLYSLIATAEDVEDARRILHTRFSGGGTAGIVAEKLYPLLSE